MEDATVTTSKSVVRFKVFRGGFDKWETLFAKAAEFASGIGHDRVISISHSEDEVVTVWYWSDEAEPRT
jgi:hypothetical protein